MLTQVHMADTGAAAEGTEPGRPPGTSEATSSRPMTAERRTRTLRLPIAIRFGASNEEVISGSSSGSG
jgi:hypothetical protein